MAIPSGSGTEVLRRISINGQSTTETAIDWAQAVQVAGGNSSGTTAIPANVIITILTVFFCNRSGASRNLDMKVDRAVSASAIHILKEQTIADGLTFVFSDRLIMRENDTLNFDSSGNNVDIHVNFIYQDWT